MKPKRAQPYPEIQAAAQAVTSALTPFVSAVSGHPAFTGAVLFVPDGHHAGAAGAAVTVNAGGRSRRQLAFTQRHVAGRRVDLRASTLGEMFRDPRSAYLPSRLNPRGHQVFGLGVPSAGGAQGSPRAMVQLAFDVHQAHTLPAPTFIQDAFADAAGQVTAATHELLRAGQAVPSIADALLLATPTTPNAYVVIWDVAGSTKLARTQYGWLRHYLNEFGGRVAALVDEAGGRITSHRGDGQNIVLVLPETVDPADPASLRQYEADVAQPLVRAIIAAHSAIGRPMGIKIRLSHGLTHVEASYLGEMTGPGFFSLAKSLKASQPE